MEGSHKMKIVVAGGGTGGHIYPAVAVIDCLREAGHSADVVFVGTRRGLERSIVPALGYRMRRIVSRPLPMRRDANFIYSLMCAFVGLLQSIIILMVDRPNVVLGTGGYACGPFVVAARLMGVPTLLIEPNSIPGRTTMVLARFANEVALGFQESVRHFARGTNLRVTGIPTRTRLVDRKREGGIEKFDLDPARKTIFVFGGSRGASSINRALVGAVRALRDRKDLQFLVQTGETDYGPVSKAMKEIGVLTRVYPYIEDIGYAYAASDLVVSRAGAGTVAELTACGLPSILVPYPHATARHQEANARLLERSGAASVIRDEDLNGEVLAEAICSIIYDSERIAGMSGSSRSLGKPDAAREIATHLVELAASKRRLSKLATVLGDICSVR
jgi:UDP-N-acetylglucosamine--N-acetylmuramyl-(pentapeptide) pyrophosphoryl-undecaprenol N-acetylglucosamine transferase